MSANASKYMLRSREKLVTIKTDFYKLTGFPGILDYVDESNRPTNNCTPGR